MSEEAVDSAVSEELLSKLAAIEHDRWAHWQRYLHEHATKNENGSLTIPAELVIRWERLIATPYDQLTEEEKKSDVEQVMKYLPTIVKAIKNRLA